MHRLFLPLVAFLVLVAASIPHTLRADTPSQPAHAAKVPKEKHVKKGQETGYDVTNTVEGRTFIDEAIAHMKSKGKSAVAAHTLRAFNFGAPDSPNILVMPKTAEFEEATTRVHPNGDVETTAAINVQMSAPSTKSGSSTLSYGDWTRISEPCYYLSNNTGSQTYCGHLYRENNDTSSTKDFYQVNVFGTAKATNPWALSNQTVETVRDPSRSGPMTWVDWKPRSDASVGSCSTVELGLYGLAISGNQCETWDITFYNTEPGHFKNIWRSSNFAIYNSEREVEFTQEVSVPQGNTIWWTLRGGFYCSI